MLLSLLVASLSFTTVHGDSARAITSGVSIAAPASASASWNGVADSIVVEKAAHKLTLYRRGVRVREYLIALGKDPVGDKIRAGDNRTPEGVFHIDARNPQSKYHLALHVSYPDANHRTRAASLGVAPGGDIMVHGLPPRYAFVGDKHRDYDWTNGCIALTDKEIEEIYSAVPDGTPIEIRK